MKDYCWESINSFSSAAEFKRFLKWIEEQVEAKVCEEVEMNLKVSMPPQERVFRCLSSNEVWVLSFPDPGYSRGSWLPK